MKTAFLVDGGFFLRRYRRLRGDATPRKVARDLHGMCLDHLQKLGRDKNQLYRIFYYDCPPLEKKVHNPVNSQAIDFAKSPTYAWRHDFLNELRRLRKVAVRLGYLDANNARWVLREDKLRALLRKQIGIDDLQPEDVKYDVRQKGVDMKIGLDIASMSYKSQVDQLVLVSGDSDFVAAAKLARREGIDFILDPMWHKIRDDLHEHIDGLQGTFARLPSAQPSPGPLIDIAQQLPTETPPGNE